MDKEEEKIPTDLEKQFSQSMDRMFDLGVEQSIGVVHKFLSKSNDNLVDETLVELISNLKELKSK